MTLIPLDVASSNAKTLDGIRTRPQNRNKNKRNKPRDIVGVDTETDKGNIFLVADSEGNYLESISFDSIAEFLFKHEDKWIFFYNLDYDAGCILKLLPKEILEKYRWKKELRFQYKKYSVHYIDRKKLTIRKGKHSVQCYDIAQYYEGKDLVTAYKDSIKKPLEDWYLESKKKRSSLSKFYYSRHKREVRKYCIYDCIMTKTLAGNWISMFFDVFRFYPDNWISAGYLAEKVLINYDIQIPLFNEISYEIQELARKCFYGGRFELIKRGYIGQCYLYDINSAYPYALTTIPDITKGRWINSKKINPKSKVGFFEIICRISEGVKIAPFAFIKKNRTICYPSGQFRTFVTLDEIKMIENDPNVRITIIDSWQFIPSKNARFTFRDFIIKQYSERLKLKNDCNPLEKTIKIILNSIYGKMAQKANNRMGNLFNPVIASYITGFTRAQLYNFVKKNCLENYVVAFATDSIACQKEIDGLNSTKLGEMKLDKKGNDVIFLSNGFYRFNDTWKKRGLGFDNSKKLEVEHEDTKIGKDGQLYIGLKSSRTTHIKSGILYNRLKDVGKIEQYEKKINLNSDKKRFWFSDLESLKDGSWCDSVPIPVDLVGDIIGKEDLEWYDSMDEKYEPESEL